MMRSIVGLWRWRGNPLRRRSDSREGLLALGAVVLIVVGAPLVGWLGAGVAQDALLRSAHEERLTRHQVWARAESVRTREPLDADPESAGQHTGRRHVVALWAGPDGSSHRSTIGTERRVRQGDRFRLWTDERGRVAARPMTPRTASSYAALAGLALGATAAVGVEAGRRLTVRQLLRRRYALWDAEWDRIGPDWGRTGSTN
ncbi:MAG: Rv1733c family protein [Streptomyces sp.]|uniref:Rv1733c family protein n=1 Tax=Streptomyces sp. TaxID=1931 RepID=UPI003D6B29B7